jgi:hypothetical protein
MLPSTSVPTFTGAPIRMLSAVHAGLIPGTAERRPSVALGRVTLDGVCV